MTPERWQKIGSLFESALGLEPERRAAFLSAACAGDEALKREVESLLAHDRAASFMKTAALADAARVMVMTAAGATPTQLTADRGQSYTHSWSPDGDRIAFAGLRGGHWNVWWVSRSTKMQKQLTNYAKPNAFVRYPAWSPRGDQIVYEYAETTGNVWLVELK